MILAADIGGTKTILALYRYQGDDWSCYAKNTYPSKNYSSFEDLLSEFLGQQTEVLQSICIGVAGPVVNDQCQTTNLPWSIRRDEIVELTGCHKVKLLNDLEATAWGLLELPKEDFVELNAEAQQAQGHVAVIAAGTGLGEALIFHLQGADQVIATEGGHTDFAPQNDLEISLLRYLMTHHPGHVSYERVVCGQGLVNIYQFLKSINYAAVDEQVEQRMAQGDAAAVISSEGQNKLNTLCNKALQMFSRIYGAEAGNLALKSLSKGGVVLAGGIAAKNLSVLQNGDFMQGFTEKGRYRSLMQSMSVKVCLNLEAALIGAFHIAKTHENENRDSEGN